MPRPPSTTLTDAELRLMKVFWERGASTSGEVVQAVSGSAGLAESTVRTMLGILVEKGYLRAERQGRTYLYHPLVTQAQARRHVVRDVVRRFFDGSPRELLLNLLRTEEIDAAELERLRRLVEEEEG